MNYKYYRVDDEYAFLSRKDGKKYEKCFKKVSHAEKLLHSFLLNKEK